MSHARRNAAADPSVLRVEIVKGQAESLGRAGRKLEASIERFNRAVETRASSHDCEDRLDEVASCAWALVVQREVIGFRQENLRWVRDEFDVPVAALDRLGRRLSV